LIYSEDDTVTHLVPPHDYRYNCPDGFASENVILRNILGALRDGGTAWYMDWFGQNWYRDPALMASFALTRAFAERRLMRDCRSAAEIAVFVSEETAFRLKPQSPDLVPWALEPLAELFKLGAPVDTFLLTDLPLALKADKARPYRLLIFLDGVDPNAEEIAAIRAAETSGLRMVWVCPAAFKPAGPGRMLPLPLDASQMAEEARMAGVHRYSMAGEYVAAEADWLCLHASTCGSRRVSLPEPKDWQDGMSGAIIAEATSMIDIEMQAGETRICEFKTP
jgi:hypothetical protein